MSDGDTRNMSGRSGLYAETYMVCWGAVQILCDSFWGLFWRSTNLYMKHQSATCHMHRRYLCQPMRAVYILKEMFLTRFGQGALSNLLWYANFKSEPGNGRDIWLLWCWNFFLCTKQDCKAVRGTGKDRISMVVLWYGSWHIVMNLQRFLVSQSGKCQKGVWY